MKFVFLSSTIMLCLLNAKAGSLRSRSSSHERTSSNHDDGVVVGRMLEDAEEDWVTNHTAQEVVENAAVMEESTEPSVLPSKIPSFNPSTSTEPSTSPSKNPSFNPSTPEPSTGPSKKPSEEPVELSPYEMERLDCQEELDVTRLQFQETEKQWNLIEEHAYMNKETLKLFSLGDMCGYKDIPPYQAHDLRLRFPPHFLDGQVSDLHECYSIQDVLNEEILHINAIMSNMETQLQHDDMVIEDIKAGTTCGNENNEVELFACQRELDIARLQFLDAERLMNLAQEHAYIIHKTLTLFMSGDMCSYKNIPPYQPHQLSRMFPPYFLDGQVPDLNECHYIQDELYREIYVYKATVDNLNKQLSHDEKLVADIKARTWCDTEPPANLENAINEMKSSYTEGHWQFPSMHCVIL